MHRLPDEVSRELERVVRRWRELPTDRALAASGAMRDLVQDLADATTVSSSAPSAPTAPGAHGAQGRVVPELGPAVLIDQLRVLVWDGACAGVPDLAERLAELRRTLP